jgi:hypothetical protein
MVTVSINSATFVGVPLSLACAHALTLALPSVGLAGPRPLYWSAVGILLVAVVSFRVLQATRFSRPIPAWALSAVKCSAVLWFGFSVVMVFDLPHPVVSDWLHLALAAGWLGVAVAMHHYVGGWVSAVAARTELEQRLDAEE